MIQIRDLRKSFDGQLILNKLNADLQEGKITAIVAPNGSGKTTLLSIIGGLLLSDEGEVIFDSPKREKDVTIVLAGEKNLYMKNTVKENIYYFGVLRGMTRREISGKLNEYVGEFPIIGKIQNTAVEKLSYGQKRIAALLSALIPKVRCILLDELTEGLDAGCVKCLAEMLKKAEKEKIIVLVSHDYDFVSGIADKILFLKNGSFVEKEKLDISQLKAVYASLYEEGKTI